MLGHNFRKELKDAGLWGNVVNTYSADGEINYVDGASAQNIAAVEALKAAHVPVAPVPDDPSDSDKRDRTTRVLIKMIADALNINNAQARALFKNKWDNTP